MDFDVLILFIILALVLAGVLGFFSASSIWPFVMTVAIVIMSYGIAFWHLWLLAFGAVVLIWAGTMLNLQYGLPPEKH